MQGIIENLSVLTTSVSGPEYEGDDRDRIIALLNQLLASCGVGNGYYRKGVPPYNYNNMNPFYRLKSVGYNRLSKHKNLEGLVSLMLKVPADQLENVQQRQKAIDAINHILRTKPGMGPSLLGATAQQTADPGIKIYTDIKSIVSHEENITEIVICVNEYRRGIWNASQLYSELTQPDRLNQLKQQLNCEKIVPLMELSQDELDNYLRRPPPGFEEIWSQAIKENPDPTSLVPYPIIGFEQLTERQKKQKTIVANQKIVINDLIERLSQLEQEICTAHNKFAVFRHAQKQLSFRLLRILATQTLMQRYGLMLDDKEEQLQARLETLNAHLNAPDKLRSRIIRIFELLRNDGDWLKKRAQEHKQSENILVNNVTEIRRCLFARQTLLEELVSSLKTDMEVLDTIEHNREK